MNATLTPTAESTISSSSAISNKVILSINAAESFVQVSWTSAPTADELTAFAGHLSTIIKQNQITQLLHDVRLVNYVNIDLQRCLAHVFCPQVVTAGVTKVVHLANYILPDLLVIDQIMDCVKRKYITDRNTKLEICTTPEGAAEWFNYNTFSKPVIITKQEEVKAETLKATTTNKVSPVVTLLSAYKEKVGLVAKILFKPKALIS